MWLDWTTDTVRVAVLFWAALFVYPTLGTAQSLSVPAGDPLSFRVFEPPKATPSTPIVIALHPVGSNNQKFGKLIKRLMKLPYRLVLPNAPFRTRRGHSWYKIRSASSDADVASSGIRLLALVDALGARWPTAPRPVLLGYSQGAVMAFHMTANHGDRFSAVVALAGYLVPDNARIQASNTNSPPLFVSHGERDKTIPFQEGREAAIAFFEQGFNLTFFPHKGGHGCPRRVWREAATWIQSEMTP